MSVQAQIASRKRPSSNFSSAARSAATSGLTTGSAARSLCPCVEIILSMSLEAFSSASDNGILAPNAAAKFLL